MPSLAVEFLGEGRNVVARRYFMDGVFNEPGIEMPQYYFSYPTPHKRKFGLWKYNHRNDLPRNVPDFIMRFELLGEFDTIEEARTFMALLK